ncbi:MAG: DUF475 domain-containing protein [Candidatus Taylorbacteria bacterium]|nr:DUF475 domain-containing protein [Candidatus Taylorbacteria bacterium]
MSGLITILGLALFEVVNSVDNAVINAEVLSKMGQRARRWFLLWGILFAVFLVRGLLPWVIIWLTSGELTMWQALVATFSSSPEVHLLIEQSAPPLLVGAGVFLVFLFLHWLFLEDKSYGLLGERFIHRHGLWFYTFASVILTVIVWFSIKTNPVMAMGAVIGSTAFFMVHGFKENAESVERRMLSGGVQFSDWSKIMYLEAIDACFSIDGVLGAFAFTLSIPLIIIGNGIGAIVVRQLTIGNIERVKKFVFLKNGAMYSILCLGVIMLFDAFGLRSPSWLSPVMTAIIIGWFFTKSLRLIKKADRESATENLITS